MPLFQLSSLFLIPGNSATWVNICENKFGILAKGQGLQVDTPPDLSSYSEHLTTAQCEIFSVDRLKETYFGFMQWISNVESIKNTRGLIYKLKSYFSGYTTPTHSVLIKSTISNEYWLMFSPVLPIEINKIFKQVEQCGSIPVVQRGLQ